MSAQWQLASLLEEGNIERDLARATAHAMLFRDRPRLWRRLTALTRALETEMDRSGLAGRQDQEL